MDPSADWPDPHDRLIRETLARTECLSDLARTYLPPDVAELLDLEHPERIEGTWVDPDLRKHASDVLCRFPLKQSLAATYLLLLVEHKSVPDRRTAIQLHRYQVLEWTRLLNEAPDAPLPVVIPMVLYHGGRRWRFDHRFESQFGDVSPSLSRYVPKFDCELVDLSRGADARRPSSAILQSGLRILAAVGRDDLATEFDAVFRLLSSRGLAGVDYAKVLLAYLTHASDLTRPDYDRVVAASFATERESMMQTYAMTLREEGRQEGRQEGRDETLRLMRQLLVEQLRIRFGPRAAPTRRRAVLDRLSAEGLTELGRVLLTIQSPAELDRWLRDHVASNES